MLTIRLLAVLGGFPCIQFHGPKIWHVEAKVHWVLAVPSCSQGIQIRFEAKVELLGLSREIWKPLCCVKNTPGVVEQLVFPGLALFTRFILCPWLGTSAD
jgi:hypothetical protein